jgi:hypothetical protein
VTASLIVCCLSGLKFEFMRWFLSGGKDNVSWASQLL